MYFFKIQRNGFRRNGFRRIQFQRIGTEPWCLMFEATYFHDTKHLFSLVKYRTVRSHMQQHLVIYGKLFVQNMFSNSTRLFCLRNNKTEVDAKHWKSCKNSLTMIPATYAICCTCPRRRDGCHQPGRYRHLTAHCLAQQTGEFELHSPPNRKPV